LSCALTISLRWVGTEQFSMPKRSRVNAPYSPAATGWDNSLLPGIQPSMLRALHSTSIGRARHSLGHGMPDKLLGPGPECASARPQTPVGATKAHPRSGFPAALLLAGSQVRSCSTDGQTPH